MDNSSSSCLDWFHGNIGRVEVENLLKPYEDGVFLVRISTHYPTDYTLCICYQNKVMYYRLKAKDNKFTIDDELFFDHMSKLIEHYKVNSTGICCRLFRTVKRNSAHNECVRRQKMWLIPDGELEIQEILSNYKYDYSTYYLGLLQNKKVAVKILKDGGRLKQLSSLTDQASRMILLTHENVVKFMGLIFAYKSTYLVMAYMSNCSLIQYLREENVTVFNQINFACNICSGMEYLRANNIIHEDLAARNVQLSANNIAKVSNLICTKEQIHDISVEEIIGKWTAPEVLNGVISNNPDVWSFGILLWEIYSFGNEPYEGKIMSELIQKIENGYRLKLPENCPKEVYTLMQKTWNIDPAKRPSFSTLNIELRKYKEFLNNISL